jgi:hypothetical protein
MFIIAYEGGFLGGFGDRIVGLLSVYVLAKIFGRPFKILWKKENIRTHVDYSRWDAEDPAIQYPPYIPKHIILSNEPHRLLRQLRSDPLPRIFPQAAVKFVLNQELVRWLYKNPHLPQNICAVSYNERMLSAYRDLYTQILPPTAKTLERVQQLVGNRKDLVGIQLRGGDIYMNPAESHKVLDDGALPAILQRIADHLAESSLGAAPIFITSDMGEKVLEAAKTVWNPERILYNGAPVQHMDWAGGASDVADTWKVYVDNYILATCTQRLYITRESNYGRIAALAACPSQGIWDAQTCTELVPAELFAKTAA